MGVRNSRRTLKRKSETREQTNARLTQEMRSSGQEYLRRNPQAFGGGIDPETGVRYVEEERVSVTSPEEVSAGAKPISLRQAQLRERNARLVVKMREGGRNYLARNPKAFGGGIDPYSGVRLKEYFEQLQKSLPRGERLIRDKDYYILGIDSTRLGQSINFDDAGVDYYNKEMNKLVVNKPFNFKDYAQELKQQDLMTGQSTIQPKIYTPSGFRKEIEKRLRFMDSKTQNNIMAIGNSLSNRELQQLQYLQNKKNLTAQEQKDKIFLQKNTARNYQRVAEIIFNTVYGSIFKAGFGTFDLLNLLRKNPIQTLMILPPAILSTVRADFKTLMSGDPLKIGIVGAEYWTYGEVFRFAGKGAKLSYANSVKLGKYLMPNYFKNIAKDLKITGRIVTRITSPEMIRIQKSLKNFMVKNKGKISKSIKIERNLLEYKLKNIVGKSKIARRTIKKITTKQKEALSYIQKAKNSKRMKELKKERIKEIKLNKKRSLKEYELSLKRAKKLREQYSKKWKETVIKNTDYKKAKVLVDNYIDSLATFKVLKFVKEYVRKGGKISKTEVRELIEYTKRYYRTEVGRDFRYKQLTDLAKKPSSSIVRLRKISKLESAKLYLEKIINRLNNTSISKKITQFVYKIKGGVSRTSASAKRPIQRIIKKIKTKRTTRQERKRLLERRKENKIKKLRSGKINIMKLQGGSGKYSNLVNFIDDYAKGLEVKYTIQLYKYFLKKGWKPINKRAKIDAKIMIRRYVKENIQNILSKNNQWKSLKQLAKTTDPNKKILISRKEIMRQLKMVKKLQQETKPKPNFITKLNSKLMGFEKKLRTRRAIKERAISYKQSNAYSVDRSRNIRTITAEEISRARTKGQINSVVNRIFDEIKNKQSPNINQLKINQLKNLIKKRMWKSISRKDNVAFNKITNLLKRMHQESVLTRKLPDIKVVQIKPRISRSMKPFVIKEFKPSAPTGSYKEIKVGSTITLQKMAPLQTVTKKVRQKQILKIVSINKKVFNFRPIVKMLLILTIRSMLKNMSRNKMAQLSRVTSSTLPITLTRTSPMFKEDVLSLTAFIPASAIAQDVRTEIKKITPTPQKRKYKEPKKKKSFRLKIIAKEYPRLKGKKYLGYNVIIKRRSRFMKQNSTPLSSSDAKDLMAYILDTTPARTGRVLPVGVVSRLGSIRANISGYYSKNSKKFRVFRIRKGKIIMLGMTWIEKRKYALDTRRERKTLRGLRRKVVKRRVIRRRRRR